MIITKNHYKISELFAYLVILVILQNKLYKQTKDSNNEIFSEDILRKENKVFKFIIQY